MLKKLLAHSTKSRKRVFNRPYQAMLPEMHRILVGPASCYNGGARIGAGLLNSRRSIRASRVSDGSTQASHYSMQIEPDLRVNPNATDPSEFRNTQGKGTGSSHGQGHAGAGKNRTRRHYSQNRAWQLHTYGGPQDLQLNDSLKMPVISAPSQVLIKVHAASVNPIDVLMANGYGSNAINCIRGLESGTRNWTTFADITRAATSFLKSHIEFPLILGRDFAGVVQQVGHSVRNVNVGDEVFGVLGIQDSGTHTDHIVASSNLIRRKPRNLTFVEAASIPYAGLTAWSAIRVTGSYYFSDLNRKKFLVLGGSGGVGTIAVQYLKSCGAYVVTTCSPDAIPLLSGLGCDFVVDYKSEDCFHHLKSYAPFDCVLDLTGPKRQSDKLLNLLRATGQKITLSPPLMGNLDKYGLVGGMVKSAGDLALDNWKSLSSEQVCTKWGFFIPSGDALQELSDTIEQDKIQPVVQEVFKFDSLPSAYQKMQDGHARGKIVIDFE